MRFVVVLLLREAVLVEVERVTRDESVMTLCVRVNVLVRVQFWHVCIFVHPLSS